LINVRLSNKVNIKSNGNLNIGNKQKRRRFMSYEIQTQQNVGLVSEVISNPANANSSVSSLGNNTLQLQPDTFSSLQMQKLQERMNQLEKAVLGLGKKESYVAAMAVDLEHMMMILIKRLDGTGDRVVDSAGDRIGDRNIDNRAMVTC
jgi:hypothetical protein